MVQKAAALLHAGKLVAFPTETVYGLGADATNPDAVNKIYAAKGRPANHPVIVHLKNEEQLTTWASNIPSTAWKLAKQFWPGPLTLILQRAPQVLDNITGGQNTIAVRVPGHPLAQELLHAFGGGIAAPSANRFGRISPTKAEHVREELGPLVDLILDGGDCTFGIESTIVDLSSEFPRILRPGTITASQINSVLSLHVQSPASKTQTPRTPGALLNHYAPTTPLHLIAPSKLRETIEMALDKKKSVAILTTPNLIFEESAVTWVPMPSEPDNYAHHLYAKLHELDHKGLDCIFVTTVPPTEDWLAISDRLSKATTKI